MMQNKIISLIVLWVVIIFAYIAMAVMMPAVNELSSQAATDIEASANMSNMPGTLGIVESSPVWMWFIPGLVGMISTVWILKFSKEE